MSPNIVWFITDDQPKGTLDAMPTLQTELMDKGVRLNNYITPTALCSPSRAAMLTGNYSHTTDVWTNQSKKQGAWTSFAHNESDTVATRLHDAGYYTALFGKYINKFSASGDTYVPPGWDTFRAFQTTDAEGAGSYYNYILRGTEPVETFGSAPEDYSTDVIRDKAVQFIPTVPSNQPLFLWFAPWAPHGPFIPAPRHAGTWPTEGTVEGFNEADMSDKPAWVQARPLADEAKMIDDLTKTHEVLKSVDDAVAALLQALDDAGRLSDTFFIFSSDNGKMLGAHRLVNKDVAYRWASEVPCVMRWDGHITPNTTNTRLTPSIDITAAIAEAAGIVGWDMDGTSYLSTSRDGCAMEQMENPEQSHPAYCGYRTAQYLYVEWTRGEVGGKELYDYSIDPWELDNKAFDPAYATIVDDMATKARQVCSPPPPGFEWRNIRGVCDPGDAAVGGGGGGGGGGGNLRFAGDPGPNKMLLGWNTVGSDFADMHDLRGKLRNLSSTNFPARPKLSYGCYRAFWDFNGTQSFGNHADTTWGEIRSAAANCNIVSISYDVGGTANAQKVYDGTYDTWIDTKLAPALIDFYERYGTSLIIDMANEPEFQNGQWNVPQCLTRMRRGARYLHFRLLSQNVPEAAFMIGTPTLVVDGAKSHAARADVPIQLSATSWPNGVRGDAIYYYVPDWKGTKTPTATYWTDAFTPNPADFIQPGEPDQWGYGDGPVTKFLNFNSYDKAWEQNPGYSTLNQFRGVITSKSSYSGNHFVWNGALWGGDTPVLPVSTANKRGLPVSIGEWGYGMWSSVWPATTTSSDVDETADMWANVHVPDLVQNNVVAVNKWRYYAPAYDGTDSNADSFTFHWIVGVGQPGGQQHGSHTYDNNNSNSKAYAAMWSRTEVVNPSPWPDGTTRPISPQHPSNSGH